MLFRKLIWQQLWECRLSIGKDGDRADSGREATGRPRLPPRKKESPWEMNERLSGCYPNDILLVNGGGIKEENSQNDNKLTTKLMPQHIFLKVTDSVKRSVMFLRDKSDNETFDTRVIFDLLKLIIAFEQGIKNS